MFLMKTKTVFIILNYKTYSETIKLVDYLLTQDLGNRAILIVDNASPNESYECLKETYKNSDKVEVIQTKKNEGYSKGNNFGLRYAKKYNPIYVCVINNDVYFKISTIQKMENLYSSIKDIAILSPIQYLLDGKIAPFKDLKKIPSFIYDLLFTIGINIGKNHVYISDCEKSNLQEVKIVPGAFIFINYDVFKKIDFFYEKTFLYCEERFLAKKIQDAHLHSYIVLDEKYLHAHSFTIKKEATKKKQLKMLLDGKILYTRSYRSMPLLKIFLLYIVFYTSLFLRSILKK